MGDDSPSETVDSKGTPATAPRAQTPALDPRRGLATFTPVGALRLIDETRRLVTAQTPGRSLLSLTHVRDSHFDTAVLRAMRALAEHITGRSLRAFDDLEEAKEFLAAQA